MGKSGISVKGTMDYNSVISFLEDVVKSFKERTVVVQRGDEFVTLTPADNIEVEVEAVEKKGKQKFNIELEWREEVETKTGTPFKVSSEEPEIQESEEETTEGTSSAEPKVVVSVCKTDNPATEEATVPAKEQPKAPAKEEPKTPAKEETKTPAKGGAKK